MRMARTGNAPASFRPATWQPRAELAKSLARTGGSRTAILPRLGSIRFGANRSTSRPPMKHKKTSAHSSGALCAAALLAVLPETQAQDEGDSQLQTVTITARKRVEPMQEVPESISAYSSNEL